MRHGSRLAAGSRAQPRSGAPGPVQLGRAERAAAGPAAGAERGPGLGERLGREWEEPRAWDPPEKTLCKQNPPPSLKRPRQRHLRGMQFRDRISGWKWGRQSQNGTRAARGALGAHTWHAQERHGQRVPPAGRHLVARRPGAWRCRVPGEEPGTAAGAKARARWQEQQEKHGRAGLSTQTAWPRVWSPHPHTGDTSAMPRPCQAPQHHAKAMQPGPASCPLLYSGTVTHPRRGGRWQPTSVLWLPAHPHAPRGGGSPAAGTGTAGPGRALLQPRAVRHGSVLGGTACPTSAPAPSCWAWVLPAGPRREAAVLWGAEARAEILRSL